MLELSDSKDDGTISHKVENTSRIPSVMLHETKSKELLVDGGEKRVEQSYKSHLSFGSFVAILFVVR